MMTLNISKKYLANKIAKGFNEDVKSLMDLNNTETRHKGILHNHETNTKILYDLQKRYKTGV